MVYIGHKRHVFNSTGALTNEYHVCLNDTNESHDYINDTNESHVCIKDTILPLPLDGTTHNIESKSLRIITWNINGTGNKHSKLYEEDVQELLFGSNDVVILTETHAKNNLNFEDIPFFTYYNYPRKFVHRNSPCPSGGIGIFIRDTILDGIEIYSNDESIVWVIFKSGFFGWEKDTLLACVYFTPENSSYLTSTNVNTNYFYILRNEVSKHIDKGNILICGDLNARMGQKQDTVENITGTDGPLGPLLQDLSNEHCDSKRYSKDQGENEYGKELIDFCKGTGLVTVNGRMHNDKCIGNYTYYHPNGGKSLIDYLLAMPSYMSNIDSFTVSTKRADSDHVPIRFSIKLPKPVHQNVTVDTGETQMAYKWDASKIGEYKETFTQQGCINFLNKLIEESANPECTSEKMTEIFYDYLNSAIDANFSRRKVKTTTKFPRNKWFDQDCKIAKRKVHDYVKKHDILISPHTEQLRLLQTEYNRIRQNKRRSYEQEIREKLENMMTENLNAYWKLWDSLRPVKVNKSNLALNDLHEYIKSQVRPPDVDYFDQEHMRGIESFVNKYLDSNNEEHNDHIQEIDFDICNAPITEDEIQIHLSKLKNNKSAGIDGISGEFIKTAADELGKPLLILFNHIFDNRDFPKKWAEGIIHPIHKKGSQHVADNYRKITVMAAVGKLFESIMNSRLKYRNIVLEKNDENQFGFKENCRTTDNMFILNSLIDRQKYKKKPLYTCFVDFTKAFDYINRAALYYKLIKRGVNGKLLKIICSMYKNATCRVKWKGNMGGKIDSEFGVLQGGMTSPFLFSEFLYDLKEYLEIEYGAVLGDKLLAYLLFADDLVLCAESAKDLQKLLNGLETFCKKWHLIVSLTKTKVMVYHKKRVTDKFIYNGNEVEIVKQYKYLGAIFSTDTNSPFKKNSEHLSNQAQKALFALNAHVNRNVTYLAPHLAFKMFDVHINPILTYGAEIWCDSKQIDSMERLHLGYLKHVLQVKRSSCTPAIYSECGRFPIILQQKFQIINYWQRIVNLPDDHILKHAYKSYIELHNLGHDNWCKNVKDILTATNLHDVWNEQVIDNKSLLLLKEKLYQEYMNVTIENIQNSDKYPKLRTFKIFKVEYKLENYLTQLKDLRYIKALARFRISSHNLRIETGRYERESLPCGKIVKLHASKRTCKVCNTNKVEDEFHFLIECKTYSHERADLYSTADLNTVMSSEINNKIRFQTIMSSNETNILKALGKYIFTCLNKRMEILQ